MPDPQLRPALSEDGYILLHGTDPPYLIDPFFFSTLASVGRWDPEPLRRMVAEKGFSEVVLTRPVEVATRPTNRIRGRARRPGALALVSEAHRQRIERSRDRHPSRGDEHSGA